MRMAKSGLSKTKSLAMPMADGLSDPGMAVAHYRILELIGAGGMGAVYMAHDEKLDRIVALKVLPEEAVAHEDRRRRFLAGSARRVGRSNHPHILTVYEIGEAATAAPSWRWSTSKGRRSGKKSRTARSRQQRFRDRYPDRRRAKQSSRARHRSPRPQARKPDGHARRLREDSGFRAGEARRAESAARGQERRANDHPGQDAGGHVSWAR